MGDDMMSLADELGRIITAYERAMARFDGEPCAVCGDAFDHTTSNNFPVWSGTHDNLVCVVCYEAETTDIGETA
jgi:hypothetical protein